MEVGFFGTGYSGTTRIELLSSTVKVDRRESVPFFFRSLIHVAPIHGEDGDDYLSLGDRDGFPAGETPLVKVDFHLFAPCFAVAGDSKIRRGALELDEILGFGRPRPSLSAREREQAKGILLLFITAGVFATRGQSWSKLLLHAGSMPFYPQPRVLQGRSDYVLIRIVSRHAGRSCIASTDYPATAASSL